MYITVRSVHNISENIIMLCKTKGTKELLNRTQDPKQRTETQRNSRSSLTEHRKTASATRGIEPTGQNTWGQHPLPPQQKIRRKHPLPELEPPRKKTRRQHPLRVDSKLPDRTQEDSIGYQRTRTSPTEHRKPWTEYNILETEYCTYTSSTGHRNPGTEYRSLSWQTDLQKKAG